MGHPKEPWKKKEPRTKKAEEGVLEAPEQAKMYFRLIVRKVLNDLIAWLVEVTSPTLFLKEENGIS